jgi:hypothetical protein
MTVPHGTGAPAPAHFNCVMICSLFTGRIEDCSLWNRSFSTRQSSPSLSQGNRENIPSFPRASPVKNRDIDHLWYFVHLSKISQESHPFIVHGVCFSYHPSATRLKEKKEEATNTVLADQWKTEKQAGSPYFCSIVLSVEFNILLGNNTSSQG